ncbi:MAG: hypothetical protein M1816_000320 [Peltula sp. TS41687]|nr:MAG: hypothetical protein M1816_000320 [Peltula sp. TS41687]
MSSFLDKLDAQLVHIISEWNFYTTILALLVVTILAYGILTWRDPDTHPLFLLYQSNVAPVRHRGSSAVYRSLETPLGYPLKTGLAVKDADAPRWSSGRDGDLRDVWRKAVMGVTGKDGKPTGKKGKIFTVRGKQTYIEHSLEDLSQKINIIGKDIQDLGGKRVAIYIANSVEILNTVFAAAFYGFTPILLPYPKPVKALKELLVMAKADILIAGAGTVPLIEVTGEDSTLKHVIWVVAKTSRHLDWNQVPEGIGGKIGVSVWHDMIEEKKGDATSDLPHRSDGYTPENLVTVWQKNTEDVGELVEYTQGNLVAAISCLITSLPSHQRLNPSDFFFPADSLYLSYPLCLTFAALYTNASIVLNSVAGPESDLDLSTRVVAPTIIAASPETIKRYLEKNRPEKTRGLSSITYWIRSRALAAGRMPNGAVITVPISSPEGPSTTATPGKLRLMFVSERSQTDSPPLSSSDLSDLRIFTGARVIYALTAAKVAGALAATNLFDYRREEGRQSHFGAPLSALEIKLVDTKDHKTTDDGRPEGEITVKGPAVVGGEANLGIVGTFRDDHTLAYI